MGRMSGETKVPPRHGLGEQWGPGGSQGPGPWWSVESSPVAGLHGPAGTSRFSSLHSSPAEGALVLHVWAPSLGATKGPSQATTCLLLIASGPVHLLSDDHSFLTCTLPSLFHFFPSSRLGYTETSFPKDIKMIYTPKTYSVSKGGRVGGWHWLRHQGS